MIFPVLCKILIIAGYSYIAISWFKFDGKAFSGKTFAGYYRRSRPAEWFVNHRSSLRKILYRMFSQMQRHCGGVHVGIVSVHGFTL